MMHFALLIPAPHLCSQRAKPLVQVGGRAEEQIVCLSIDDPQAQRPQARRQNGPLPGDERAHLVHISGFFQGRDACRLGQTGHGPRLARCLHFFQKRFVAAEAVTQPDAGPAGELGESFQDDEIPTFQQRLCGPPVGVGQKVQKALIYGKNRVALPAPAQQLFHQFG